MKYLAYIIMAPFFIVLCFRELLNFALENTIGRLMNWAAKVVNND